MSICWSLGGAFCQDFKHCLEAYCPTKHLLSYQRSSWIFHSCRQLLKALFQFEHILSDHQWGLILQAMGCPSCSNTAPKPSELASSDHFTSLTSKYFNTGALLTSDLSLLKLFCCFISQCHATSPKSFCKGELTWRIWNEFHQVLQHTQEPNQCGFVFWFWHVLNCSDFIYLFYFISWSGFKLSAVNMS